MNKKHMLTTGEFAELCDTTKQTLLHYDKENLLKPKYVSENGYRHYGIEQLLDFDMIATFKETGSTLKEIGAYIHKKEEEDFLALFEAKRLVIKKERERLAQRETMLLDMAMCTREALSFVYDTFMVRYEEEERLDVFQTNAAPAESLSEFAEQYAEYVSSYKKQKRTPRYPFGAIAGYEDALQGVYRERYFFGRATRSTPRSQLHIKPEGRYAVLAHRGTEQTHLQAFNELLHQIQAAGLTIQGDVYAYDMMSYILHGAGKSFATRYCIRVG